MKIKALRNCWTPLPENNWKEGEEVEVSDKLGEKLLQSNNFVKVSDTKPEADNEEKKHERVRKKRRTGDRD